MLENETEEIQRYQSVISTVGAETKLHAPAALLRRNSSLYQPISWLGLGLSGRFGEENLLPLPGMEPRILDFKLVAY
jgi:hypothetical protein